MPPTPRSIHRQQGFWGHSKWLEGFATNVQEAKKGQEATQQPATEQATGAEQHTATGATAEETPVAMDDDDDSLEAEAAETATQ